VSSSDIPRSSFGAPREEPSTGSQLRHVLRVARHRWWILALFVVALTVAAYLHAARQPSEYQATTSLLYNPSAPTTALRGNPQFPDANLAVSSPDPRSGIPTITKLITTAAVRARAEQKIGRIGATLSVTPSTDANVFTFSATDRSPERAAAVANAWSRAFVDQRTVDNRSAIVDAVGLVRRDLRGQGAPDRPLPTPRHPNSPRQLNLTDSLRVQLASLEIAAALQQGDVSIAQPAGRPRSRISPTPVRDGAIGAVVGLLLGLLLLAALEVLDQRLKTVDDIERVWHTHLLASIPPSAPRAIGRQIVDPATAEAFRHLQANLTFLSVERDVHSIAVTSPISSEGKSTVAMGLATTLASAGRQVLLMDADFRQRRTSTVLKLDPLGLSNVLAGTLTLDEAIQRFPVQIGRRATESNVAPYHLAALSSGSLPPNPYEMLSSTRMTELLDRLREDWDHVIVDCAPLLPISDTIPIIAHCDGVVIAQLLTRSRADTATRTRGVIVRAGARLLGVVVGGAPGGGIYGYGYEYGYGQDPGPEQDKNARELELHTAMHQPDASLPSES